MARIKFGMMMVDARGKLGGHVFSKNRSGAICRTKVTPTNPQTVRQALARTTLAQQSQQWSMLGEDQRNSWNALASTTILTNVFGDNYKPSGKNLFVGVNANLLLVNKVPLLFAPAVVSPGSILNVTSACVIDDEELTIIPVMDAQALLGSVVYKATAPSSQGTYNFTGKYVVIASSPASSVLSPVTLWNAYVARFGVPPENTKIGISCSTISSSGASSTEAKTSCIVVAN